MENTASLNLVSKSSLRELAKKYPIRLIVLFGSAVDGQFREGSDIDLGIYLEGSIGFREETKLIKHLIHTFRRDDLDPVILNFASPLLLFEVVKKGSLLFEKKKGEFLQFKLRAIKKYWEYSKFRKYRKMRIVNLEKELFAG
jgi:predicted nucleotidyltransferase